MKVLFSACCCLELQSHKVLCSSFFLEKGLEDTQEPCGHHNGDDVKQRKTNFHIQTTQRGEKSRWEKSWVCVDKGARVAEMVMDRGGVVGDAFIRWLTRPHH